MNDLVSLINNQPRTTSNRISEHFGKRHGSVTRAIENLEIDSEFRKHNFVLSTYISLQGKELSCYEMTKDGFMLLAMGFTGKAAMKWKLKYIDAFNNMEKALRDIVPVMDQMNTLVGRMENDKQIASICGKSLSKWKKLKAGYEEKYKKVESELQITLPFSQ